MKDAGALLRFSNGAVNVQGRSEAALEEAPVFPDLVGALGKEEVPQPEAGMALERLKDSTLQDLAETSRVNGPHRSGAGRGLERPEGSTLRDPAETSEKKGLRRSEAGTADPIDHLNEALPASPEGLRASRLPGLTGDSGEREPHPSGAGRGLEWRKGLEEALGVLLPEEVLKEEGALPGHFSVEDPPAEMAPEAVELASAKAGSKNPQGVSPAGFFLMPHALCAMLFSD
jgi:hypothetical protein